MYNLKYGIGKVDLRIFGTITSFTKSILPPRSYTSYDVELLNGKIFGTSKFEPLEMKIKIFVEGKTKDDLNTKLTDIANLFANKEPAPLLIDDKVYIFCMTNDDISTEIATPTAKYVTIPLIALDPTIIENLTHVLSSPCTEFEIDYTGKIPTRPRISFSVSEDAHFIQLKYGEQQLLLGDYPKLDLPDNITNNDILVEHCADLGKCVKGEPTLLSGRDATGNITLSGNSSFTLSSLPSSSTATWKGGALIWNLSKDLTDFKLNTEIRFSSEGIVDDPNKESFPSPAKGTLKYYARKITNQKNVHIRTSKTLDKSSLYKKNGYIQNLAKGNWFYDDQYSYEDNGDWIKVHSNVISSVFPNAGPDDYVYFSNKGGEKYWKTSVCVREKSACASNYRVVGDTGDTSGIRYGVREKPTKSSKLVATVNIGDVIRCYDDDLNDLNDNITDADSNPVKWKKLSVAVNDEIGYIMSKYLAVVNPYDEGVWVDVTDKAYAPNKTGLLEIYGYSSEGSILFKFGIKDDNKYYVYNQPHFRIGEADVYTYNETLEDGELKIVNTGNKLEQYILTKGHADKFWKFIGNMWIKRIGSTYTFGFNAKDENASITKTYKSSNSDPLAAIGLFMGTSDSIDTSTSMYLDDLIVTDLNPTQEDNTSVNNIYFHEGDEIEISPQGDVTLNGVNANELLDIGSEIPELTSNEQQVKIYSDDAHLQTYIEYENQFIGGEFL